MLKHLFPAVVVLVFALLTLQAHAYAPVAQQVAGNVYAIIGPLGQRSAVNDGLNNNLGFIVTAEGVILIDSGASRLGAQRIEQAIAAVTPTPIRWVVNTGSQDHRWLGNRYFAARGAEIIAMARTAATQAQYAAQQLDGLKGFLGKRLAGTEALPATTTLEGDEAAISRGGVALKLFYTDTHYPGDAMIWLPQQKVVFSGDLVYVDRLFALLPWSSVRHGQQAFRALAALEPEYIVPGHGGVSDLAKARRECGDYYDFLNDTIGAAAREMEPMEEVLDRYTELPAFAHLEHFGELHRVNMNRTYLEYEAM